MRYLSAFLLKLILTTVILWVVLGIFYDVSLTDIFLTSFILSVVAYIADVYVLPNVSNFWATIGDFGLAFVGIWLLGQVLFERNFSLADASLISAVIIAVGEIFYHRYMKDKVNNDKNYASPREITISNRMQTEFSTEIEKDHNE
jgi:hypothetical protein